MRTLIFTSNALRHKFVTNILVQASSNTLAIVECKPAEYINTKDVSDSIKDHFKKRFETEKTYFSGNDTFLCPTVPILYKEASHDYIRGICASWKPEIIICFGASLLQPSILSLKSQTTTGYFLNLHLGLSPYYTGSGTNFWPFVNKEYQYLGSTIHHIDEGIDSGDIVMHVVPQLEKDDTVHTAGCKIIHESARSLADIIKAVAEGKRIKSVLQWDVEINHHYRLADFTEASLQQYKLNLEEGSLAEFVSNQDTIRAQTRYVPLTFE